MREDEGNRNEVFNGENFVNQKRSRQKIKVPKEFAPWKFADLPDYSRLILQGSFRHLLSSLCVSKNSLGLKNTILIATKFGLLDELDESVKALASLTGLLQGNASLIDMQSTSTLIQICSSVGNSLHDSWEIVLKCVSELEKRSINLDNDTTVQIDRIFTSTANLSAPSLVHCVNGLCEVSAVELAEKRSYSLKRIVEVAYYNINRIRFEFNQIFKLILSHFVDIVQLDEEIATFAVDSMRQLTSKFLEREELSHFNSQDEFMRPFHTMMLHVKSVAMQELILRSLQQLIQSRYKNMKSGWKAVFPVISLGKSHAIAREILLYIHQHFLELQNVHATNEYIECLSEVCCAVKSPELLETLASISSDRMLVLHGMANVVHLQASSDMKLLGVEHIFNKVESQTLSIQEAEEIINPIFQRMPCIESVWMRVLQRYVQLWKLHCDQISFRGICEALCISVIQKNEVVAKHAIVCLQQVLSHVIAISSCAKIQDLKSSVDAGTYWSILVQTISKMAADTLPRDLERIPMLGDVQDAKENSVDFNYVTQQCGVHLSILSTLEPQLSVYQTGIPLDFYAKTLSFLKTSRNFSSSFNSNLDLRTRIWKTGFTNQPPNLLSQESLSTTLIITCLFCVLEGFPDQQLPYVRMLQDIADEILAELQALPTVSPSGGISVRTKSFVSPNLSLLFNRLNELLFLRDPKGPIIGVAKDFFVKGIKALREDDNNSRVAIVQFLESTICKILDPIWR
jgi:brefeldin A-inhibited guanine nucleotide-exchange protein